MEVLIPMMVTFMIMLVVLAPVIIIILVVRMLMRGQDSRKLSREEQAQLARLMDSMDRMEQRISNLETILMQREKPSNSETRRL